MNLLNSFIALSLIILMSFSLLKTIELSGCRHEMLSKGFWMASKMLTSSDDENEGESKTSCGASLYVQKKDSKIVASQKNGEYHFQLSTDINAKKLK